MNSLINDIYEAAVITERWPALLCGLGEHFGTKGALLFTLSASSIRWVGGGAVADIMEEFMAAGWMAHNDRPARVKTRSHAGFLTELDIMSEQELQHLPMYEEFLYPHGCIAAVGTYVAGLDNDGMILSLEGFPEHHAALAAIPSLDALRPHLARAIQLAGQFKLELMRGQIEALQAIGAAACIINVHGIMKLANEQFEEELGRLIFDCRNRLVLPDKRAQEQLGCAIAQIQANCFSGRSIVVRYGQGQARVLHVLPIAGQANDIFTNAGALLILTNPAHPVDLSSELIQQMFDLTPAEARLALLVGTRNATLSQVAIDAGLSINTAKSQIKSVFQKTGTERQTDLVRLLMRTATVTPRTQVSEARAG